MIRAFVMAALMFSLTQHENFRWGFQVQFVGVYACAVASYTLLHASAARRARGERYVLQLTAAIMLLVVGAFTMANGIVAAWLPRWGAEVMMRATDVAYAFPALLLAILLAGVFGGSTTTAMIAIGMATIPQFVRVTRIGALQVQAGEFVLAARSCGTSRTAIALQHVLPNVAPVIGVQASVSFAMAILAEAALSYLGLATPPPTPTWGRMLGDAQALIWSAPLQAVWPGVAIAVAVLGFNLLGDGLRDLLDPRLREVA